MKVINEFNLLKKIVALCAEKDSELVDLQMLLNFVRNVQMKLKVYKQLKDKIKIEIEEVNNTVLLEF